MTRPPTPHLPPPNVWWFILGRNPELSQAEIASVCPAAHLGLAGPVLRAEFTGEPAFSPTKLIKRLGGIVKIASEGGRGLSETALLDAITHNLETVAGKAVFGLSWYGTPIEKTPETLLALERWGKTIKAALKQKGSAARYVESREPILSSVTVEKNNLTTRGREFIIYEEAPGIFALGTTLAVQPFEALGERDFGRPGRDDTSGMLPPKLALMLINLTGATTNQTLLDPFCGSGTILTEAMLLGFKNIIGSDISDKAVEDTRKNVAWQEDTLAKDTLNKIKIFQSDADELAGKLPSQSIDAIATEPYLGKPLRGSETRAMLEAQTQELKKIYVNAFKAFAKVVKPGAIVVFIIPCFKFQSTWLRIACTKEIIKCGFTTLPLLPDAEHVLYARPNQRVGREVWRFKKT